jgi:putative transposase
MRSNLRWCSDVFEILCWNGDIVRMRRLGTGISGSMVRDRMLDAVERRFGTVQAPHAIEWLSDNGSTFTARQTLDFAATLGLVSCFTPVQSPESNGIVRQNVQAQLRSRSSIAGSCYSAPADRQVVR